MQWQEPQLTRPRENHGLAIKHLPTWLESWCKQQSKSFVVSCSGIIGKIIQNPGDTEMYITSAARLRFDIMYNINKLRIEKNRGTHDNSWSMTLPFDVKLDNWHMPYLQKQSAPSNTEQIFMMIASFLPHHMQFMLMLSNPVYNTSKLWKFH